MQLTYNAVALHQLGTLYVLGTERRADPPENPQRWACALRVRLEAAAGGWAANADKLLSARTALSGQFKTLLWTDAASTERLNRAVSVEGLSEPEPEAGGGTAYQDLEITFRWFESLLPANDDVAFAGMSLGLVDKWEEGYAADRPNAFADPRRFARLTVEASGRWLPNPADAPASRRAALAAQKNDFLTRVDGQNGALTRTGFSETVRVTRASAALDDGKDELRWTLSAEWNGFPATEPFAFVDYTVDLRADRDGAAEELTFSGKITASTEAAARTRLDTLRDATLAARGYLLAQRTGEQTTPALFDGNPDDGSAFVELNFSERYRRFLTNFGVTFQKTGAAPALALGSVATWVENYTADRYSPMRKIRREARGGVAATGRFVAPDLSQNEATRRTALYNLKETWMAAVNGADGTLIRTGCFNKLVRVDAFTCEVNQAFDAIEWGLQFSYTAHPDEAGYTATEYSVATRTSRETSEKGLAFSGRIAATTLAGATAALDSLRTTTLAAAGYGLHNRVATDLREGRVAALDGADFMELAFEESYRAFENQVELTWTRTGGAAVTVGQVVKWSESFDCERLHPQRSLRRVTRGRVSASGQFVDNTPGLSVDARRAVLLAKAAQLRNEMNALDGLLARPGTGGFSKTVRVEQFSAEVNQAYDALEWSFTASWTWWPDEVNYATADYTAATRLDVQTGEETLALSGKIAAHSEGAAVTKLDTLRTAVLAARGFSLGQRVRKENRASTADANDGSAFLELAIDEEYRRFTATPAITYTRNGGGSAINLGAVLQWSEGYNAERPSAYRSLRRRANGSVSAAGRLTVDGSLSEVAREAALYVLKNALQAEIKNGADGRLLRPGAFDKTVRVESFTATINRAYDSLEWTLSANYTEFPNEAGYATAEFNVSRRLAKESGEKVVAFAGTILAQSASAALAKLTAIRATQLTVAGVAAGDQNPLTTDYREQWIDADDGSSFLELTFDETYRLQDAAVRSWSLGVQTQEDLRSGLLRTVFSGRVVAGGATADAAWAAALARAQLLGKFQGDGATLKYAMLVNATETRNDRLIDETGTPAGKQQFVGLEFSYEFLRKGTRIYIEAATELDASPFADHRESVGGYVVADTLANARAEYETKIKEAYPGALIIAESFQSHRQHVKSGAGYVAHLSADMPEEIRLDFRLQVFRERAATDTRITYSIDVQRNPVDREKVTRISGVVIAQSVQNGSSTVDYSKRASDFLDAFLTGLNLGTVNPGGRRSAEHIQNPAGPYGSATGAAQTRFVRLQFDETYVSALTATTGILRCELSEEVVDAGTRWVLQPLPDGPSVAQNCGTEPGSRTVRGSVSATSEALCTVWMNQKLALLTGTLKEPRRVTTDFEFLPLTDGVGRTAGDGATANFKAIRKSFSQTEHLLT